jgi:hypothetical protein
MIKWMWPVFTFFRCSNDFITQKVYNYVSGMYLVQVSLILIDQQGLGHFFRYHRPLLPTSWRILRERRRKKTNIVPTTLSAIQAASQSTFINAQLYSTSD